MALSSFRLYFEKAESGRLPSVVKNSSPSPIFGSLPSAVSAAAESGRTRSTLVLLRLPGSVQSAPASSLRAMALASDRRSEEHTSELQSRVDLVCRLLLEKKKKKIININSVKH